jgi:hypothetical protein
MVAPEPTTYLWTVERSRDPLSASQVEIVAWADDGANCGTSFGDGRWLVLAYRTEAGLETNGCVQNLRLDTAPPDMIEVVDELVATPVGPGPVDEPLSVPVPILVGIGAALVVAIVSLLAFRRGDPAARRADG